ncbi:hypothetical protein [Thermosynechococcus sp. NK55a]|uniref:hypothetical protein n=1 Tax=Thermosynechococcus sp. NK55a TaxID=1394889 RepID=UPI00190F83BB|nr:hypothetical protein [Thermosynechococcus sp. NK55a]
MKSLILLLLELLAEKVADLCGYKPDLDLCSEFLKSNRHLDVVSAYPIPSHQQTAMRRAPEHREQISRSRTTGSFSFVFEGKTYKAASAVEVMVTVFRLLAKADAGFLDRFASRNHGRKRRYIARNRQELYPGRPDLAEAYSIELVPGWYMGTNYSRKNIQQILDLALEVVDPELRSAIRVNIE